MWSRAGGTVIVVTVCETFVVDDEKGWLGFGGHDVEKHVTTSQNRLDHSKKIHPHAPLLPLLCRLYGAMED
jgi:hypothetical protein